MGQRDAGLSWSTVPQQRVRGLGRSARQKMHLHRRLHWSKWTAASANSSPCYASAGNGMASVAVLPRPAAPRPARPAPHQVSPRRVRPGRTLMLPPAAPPFSCSSPAKMPLTFSLPRRRHWLACCCAQKRERGAERHARDLRCMRKSRGDVCQCMVFPASSLMVFPAGARPGAN